MNKESKFDSYESLHNSYCELERKFTQKCQLNAELERQKQQLEQEKQQTLEEYNQLEQSNIAIKEEQQRLIEQLEEMKNSGGTNAQQASPQVDIEELYATHPVANDFRERLDNAVQNPDSNLSPQQAWQQCYVKCLEERYRSPEQLMNDRQFVQQYVVDDQNVRDLVLQKMLEQSAKDSYPVTISGNGGNMSMAQPTRPKSLKEATELAKNFFK